MNKTCAGPPTRNQVSSASDWFAISRPRSCGILDLRSAVMSGKLIASHRHGRACPGHPRSSSWPGLSRPSTVLKQFREEIAPLPIVSEDQAYFPGSWPVLHVVLALDCRLDIVIFFK